VRPARFAVVLLVLAVASGCAGVDTELLDLADDPGSDGEVTRFCLSVGRALSAIAEDGTAPAARDAAEEVLARAPAELEEPARAVVDQLQRAGDGTGAVAAAGLEDALEALRDGAQRICEPQDHPGR
jgi:hypothetical protein